MQITCKIRNNGTRKVGTRLKGRTVIATIDVLLGLINRAVVPKVTAATRSVMPRNCQRIKLLRRMGLASFHATRVAVAPIAMSPYPAGNAKMAGRTS